MTIRLRLSRHDEGGGEGPRRTANRCRPLTEQQQADLRSQAMPFALGQRLLFHNVAHGGGLVLLVAIIAIVLLIRYWPAIAAWIEQRLRR